MHRKQNGGSELAGMMETEALVMDVAVISCAGHCMRTRVWTVLTVLRRSVVHDINSHNSEYGTTTITGLERRHELALVPRHLSSFR